MGKKYTFLKEKEFENIKLLQSKGLDGRTTSQITGRSTATVSQVYRCDTWAEWRKPKVVKPPVEATPSQEETITQDAFIQALQNVNDSLTRISARLSYIEENAVIKEKSKLRRLW